MCIGKNKTTNIYVTLLNRLKYHKSKPTLKIRTNKSVDKFIEFISIYIVAKIGIFDSVYNQIGSRTLILIWHEVYTCLTLTSLSNIYACELIFLRHNETFSI